MFFHVLLKKLKVNYMLKIVIIAIQQSRIKNLDLNFTKSYDCDCCWSGNTCCYGNYQGLSCNCSKKPCDNYTNKNCKYILIHINVKKR
jgi:hypothetical protein